MTDSATRTAVTVETIIDAPLATVWEKWTNPADIVNWYFASDDWHAPHAENDLREGGRFRTTMAAKDGSFSFDFAGAYDSLEVHKLMAFTIDDGRRVQVVFSTDGDTTRVSETFETEHVNPQEMQRQGWQAILDNFKIYVESL